MEHRPHGVQGHYGKRRQGHAVKRLLAAAGSTTCSPPGRPRTGFAAFREATIRIAVRQREGPAGPFGAADARGRAST
jgi:hypothetical protein